MVNKYKKCEHKRHLSVAQRPLKAVQKIRNAKFKVLDRMIRKVILVGMNSLMSVTQHNIV